MTKKWFARQLRDALSARGIRQVDLVSAIGVPPTTVSG
jgi:hypothetical protein